MAASYLFCLQIGARLRYECAGCGLTRTSLDLRAYRSGRRLISRGASHLGWADNGNLGLRLGFRNIGNYHRAGGVLGDHALAWRPRPRNGGVTPGTTTSRSGKHRLAALAHRNDQALEVRPACRAKLDRPVEYDRERGAFGNARLVLNSLDPGGTILRRPQGFPLISAFDDEFARIDRPEKDT